MDRWDTLAELYWGIERLDKLSGDVRRGRLEEIDDRWKRTGSRVVL